MHRIYRDATTGIAIVRADALVSGSIVVSVGDGDVRTVRRSGVPWGIVGRIGEDAPGAAQTLPTAPSCAWGGARKLVVLRTTDEASEGADAIEASTRAVVLLGAEGGGVVAERPRGAAVIASDVEAAAEHADAVVLHLAGEDGATPVAISSVDFAGALMWSVESEDGPVTFVDRARDAEVSAPATLPATRGADAIYESTHGVLTCFDGSCATFFTVGVYGWFDDVFAKASIDLPGGRGAVAAHHRAVVLEAKNREIVRFDQRALVVTADERGAPTLHVLRVISQKYGVPAVFGAMSAAEGGRFRIQLEHAGGDQIAAVRLLAELPRKFMLEGAAGGAPSRDFSPPAWEEHVRSGALHDDRGRNCCARNVRWQPTPADFSEDRFAGAVAEFSARLPRALFVRVYMRSGRVVWRALVHDAEAPVLPCRLAQAHLAPGVHVLALLCENDLVHALLGATRRIDDQGTPQHVMLEDVDGNVMKTLPGFVHLEGAHVGTPVCARREGDVTMIPFPDAGRGRWRRALVLATSDRPFSCAAILSRHYARGTARLADHVDARDGVSFVLRERAFRARWRERTGTPDGIAAALLVGERMGGDAMISFGANDDVDARPAPLRWLGAPWEVPGGALRLREDTTLADGAGRAGVHIRGATTRAARALLCDGTVVSLMEDEIVAPTLRRFALMPHAARIDVRAFPVAFELEDDVDDKNDALLRDCGDDDIALQSETHLFASDVRRSCALRGGFAFTARGAERIRDGVVIAQKFNDNNSIRAIEEDDMVLLATTQPLNKNALLASHPDHMLARSGFFAAVPRDEFDGSIAITHAGDAHPLRVELVRVQTARSCAASFEAH